MEELLETGQELRLNPYVAQMEKLSESLQYLTQVFKNKIGYEDSQFLEMHHLEMIQLQVREKLCKGCERSGVCTLNQEYQLQEAIRELFVDIDEYGIELSVAKKRKLEKKCQNFEKLKEEVQRSVWDLKNHRMWEVRMAQNQDASLVALQACIQSIEEATKEIDASIFHDERMERKIAMCLRNRGVRILKVSLFVLQSGQYEIHISAKAKSQTYITTNHIANVLTKVLGRTILADKRERLSLKEKYTTMIFVEHPKYHTLCAVVQQKKEGSEISGDNFLITDVSRGKTCVMISDGMGSGRNAYRKSKILLELAEKLLESNISPRLMIQMMNAALVTEVREVEFATFDMCMVDLYKGEIELTKAGASTTYIVTGGRCKCYQASSLPIGVIVDNEVNQYLHKIEKDSYVIMVSDGVNEALREEDKAHFIQSVIRDARTQNTKELASHFLEKVLALQKGIAKDDMMVLVLGVWELQF